MKLKYDSFKFCIAKPFITIKRFPDVLKCPFMFKRKKNVEKYDNWVVTWKMSIHSASLSPFSQFNFFSFSFSVFIQRNRKFIKETQQTSLSKNKLFIIADIITAYPSTFFFYPMYLCQHCIIFFCQYLIVTSDELKIDLFNLI